MKKQLNVLISGGGTGGHIFPALSIANGIKDRRPDANILFVGAENRMEMEKVPAAGYKDSPRLQARHRHRRRRICQRTNA